MTRTPPHLATLVLIAALPLLTLNMFLPSLPAMTLELGATEAEMALAISGYMIVSAVIQLGLGPLSDRFGRRPVLLGSVAVYALASLGAALAQGPQAFIAFRLAQALVVSGNVQAYAIVRDLYPPREAAGRMAGLSAAMALAPMLGPTLGGVLETLVGWRSIFGLYAALGALALVVGWFDLGETKPPGARRLRLADYAALLGSGRYWAYTLCQVFSLGAFFIFVTGVPFVSQALWGLSPAWVGAGIGTISGGYMLGAAITSRLAPRLGLHRMILIGRLLPSVVLSLALAAFLLGASSPWLLFGATVFVGIGNGFTIANTNSGALSVRPDLAGTAASLGGALVVAMGAALTAITLALLSASTTPTLLVALILATVLASLAAGLAALRLDHDPV